MLSSKRILLLLLFFVFSSCDFPTLPSLDLCNTQFKGGECYIQSMQKDSLNIQSYRDNAIILNYLLEDSSILVADSITYDIPDSLIIERKLESDSIYTEFIIPYTYSDTLNYYRDTMVYDTGLYHYRLATKNENGRSLYDSISINHQLPQIEKLDIGEISCSNIPISWECDIRVFSDTSGTYNTLKFQIERILLDTNITTSDTIYNIELPYEEDNTYEFNDATFDFGVVYEYKVAFQGIAINSLSAVLQTSIPNPTVNAEVIWVPISSDIMYLNWDIDGDMIYDLIKVSNKISGITRTIYQNNDSTNAGYLIDSLSTYANGIYAGQKLDYTLHWFCNGVEKIKTSHAATLPYYNMVYIPDVTDVSDYEYTEIPALDTIYHSIIDSSDAFYIDTYEITENVYYAPELNTSIEANSLPKGSLSYDYANTFAQTRHPSNSDISCDLSGIGFRIPEDYEWQIASRCQYNWENKTCDEYFDYPINVVGDNAIISCNFINYSGCCDADIDCVQSVDQYPESITPFGLYGTSGNLQEWVVNSNSSSSNKDYFKLIGGHFLSTHDEVKTTSVYYSFSDLTAHDSYGLRTVFDAEQFLGIWRDCVDQ